MNSRRTRRVRAVERLNLSEHTLDFSYTKRNTQNFDFSEVEDYVRAITGERDYQFEAIRKTMTYLWGGGYKNVKELAKENYKIKPHLQERFGSEAVMIGMLPLGDRLSGVVHMATGTGKSYVIFAVAYLSLIMGYTKRVLVLGPSSTIIEEGLNEKFREFLERKDWNTKLPLEYQNKPIQLLDDRSPMEDGSITIENINAIYRLGGIQDSFDSSDEEVLVLSDEVHHAYSHLVFNSDHNQYEMDHEIDDPSKVSEAKVDDNERLWMQFLKRYSQITRHIGFTGTPYNKDDYFADVIYDYNIRTAINDKFIKDIDPIIDAESSEDGEVNWTTEKRFEVILAKHTENKNRFSYVKNEKAYVKPITVFYCQSVPSAKRRSEEFIKFLVSKAKEEGVQGEDSAIEADVRAKVILVTSASSKADYQQDLDNIEQTDPSKVGGSVEFIFSVSKLLEGWDVDNVFQIVPMEERVFNSKLLISQVIGRGLRLPRAKEIQADIALNYPLLTITNHEKFAAHIKELMESVTNSDLYLASQPLDPTSSSSSRASHHFKLFNLSYLAEPVIKDNDPSEDSVQTRQLVLDSNGNQEHLTISRFKGTDKLIVKKTMTTVDSIVDDIYRRFKAREYENINYDFGNESGFGAPSEESIRQAIEVAMEEAGIEGDLLTESNKQQINLYFNQFLPAGKKKREYENIEGELIPISTVDIAQSSVRVGELERDAAAFISDDYKNELDSKSLTLVDHIKKDREDRLNNSGQTSLLVDDTISKLSYGEAIKTLVKDDDRPPYVIKLDEFKTPLNSVLTSHYPEKLFTLNLIQHAQYYNSWIKSPDKGFYSISYSYWRKGKDRVTRGFNPDYFIKIQLDEYIDVIKAGNSNKIEHLLDLQNNGIEEIIYVIEIKSDDDDDEATPAKAEFAKDHFERLNKKLQSINPVELPKEYRDSRRQLYYFELLKPNSYNKWFSMLSTGQICKEYI